MKTKKTLRLVVWPIREELLLRHKQSKSVDGLAAASKQWEITKNREPKHGISRGIARIHKRPE